MHGVAEDGLGAHGLLLDGKNFFLIHGPEISGQVQGHGKQILMTRWNGGCNRM